MWYKKEKEEKERKMIIYNSNKLNKIDFKNEKELQSYVEKHIQAILAYQFIATEFSVDNYRIDTLAYDKENKAFVIIEYKNIKNNSLVDQGYSYLALMLKRKEAFVLKYNNITKSNLDTKDIEWSQSRIVFIAPFFTERQITATEFQGMPFDLIKAVKYENNIVEFDKLSKNANLKENVAPKGKEMKQVRKEIKVYTEDYHLSKTTEELKEIYRKLKEEILNLGDIDIEYKKNYIAFKGSTNIVDVEIFRSKIQLFINMKPGTLKDPLNITRDMWKKGHHGNGDYGVEIKKEEDTENVLLLIKQSLEVNKK